MTTLSPEFLQQLAWVQRQMPRTQQALTLFNGLPTSRIALCTHLDIKMIPVFEALLAAGCELFITTCDPNTVRDDVVTYLVSKGAQANAWHGMSDEQWRASLQAAIDWQPDYLCEFGGELTALYHQSAGSGLKGVLEGTGSGIAKIKSLELTVPVLNWDDLDAKEGLHNRHMVGLTAWQAFCQRTHLTLHEKHITVLGYGLVGQGVAAAAKAYGGSVTVVERDPARRLMAAYDGWRTSTLAQALSDTDVLVTATGAHGIVGLAELSSLKDGAFVLNVGHGAGEVKVHELSHYTPVEVMPHVFEYSLDGTTIFLLANGAMFNLTAGFGDSLNAFDVTLCIMTGGLHYLLTQAHTLGNELTLLPDHAWKPLL